MALSDQWQTREVSVLFADLNGFNKLANIFDAQDMMAFLNRLFAVMEDPIKGHQGVIDKIIGDGIMVTFNAFNDIESHQKQAVATAMGILNAMFSFAKEEEQQIDFSIGVATGSASCGPLGTATFHPLTVVGHVVGRAVQLSTKGSLKGKSVILVDDGVFQETISDFEYQQLEDGVFMVNTTSLI